MNKFFYDAMLMRNTHKYFEIHFLRNTQNYRNCLELEDEWRLFGSHFLPYVVSGGRHAEIPGRALFASRRPDRRHTHKCVVFEPQIIFPHVMHHIK